MASSTASSSGTQWESSLTTVSERVYERLNDLSLVSADDDAKTQITSSIIDSLRAVISKQFEDRLQDEQHQHENQRRTLQQQIEELTRRNEELEESDRDWDRRMAQLRREHRDELAEVESDNAPKDREIEELQRNVARLEKQLATKEKSDEDYINNMHTTNSDLETHVERLQAELDAARNRITEQDGRLRDNRTALDNYASILAGFDEDAEKGQNLATEHAALTQRHDALQTASRAQEDRINILQEQLQQSEARIKDLQEQKASGGKGSPSPSGPVSSGGEGGGTLEGELDAAKLEDTIKKLRKDLEYHNDALTLTTIQQEEAEGKLKESEKQLDAARARIEELSKPSPELTRLRDRLAALEKRERELQARLKAKGNSSPTSTGGNAAAAEVEAALKECNEQMEELRARHADVTRELEQEKREHEADLARSGSGSDSDKDSDSLKKRIGELKRLLARAQGELKQEREARDRLIARVKELEGGGASPQELADRAAAYERRIEQLLRSRAELAEYFQKQMWETSASAAKAIADHAELVAEYRREQENAARQARTVHDRINANPAAQDVHAHRRRAAFLEAEVAKLVRRIKALQDESRWFEDLARSSQEAQRRAEDAIGDSAAAGASSAASTATAAVRETMLGGDSMDGAIIAISEARRARNGAGPGQAPRQPARRHWFGGWHLPRNVGTLLVRADPAALTRLAFQLALTFVIVSLFIISGRESATWWNSNGMVKRSFFDAHPERYLVCVGRPTWPLLWEFLGVVMTGKWIWSA
ncbi:hypothetical protein F4818DRAFT_455281 [Hypoxylon cercidicola]|nr:hypothetical protein F4818DRAFT_455281 [Hypoxylon cercidicola]